MWNCIWVKEPLELSLIQLKVLIPKIRADSNNPRTCGRFRKGLQILMTDGLTDWRTDGAAVPMFKQICFKNEKNPPNRFWKRGEIQNKMAMSKYFDRHINSNCVFSETFEETSVAQWRRVAGYFEKNCRSPTEMGQMEFSISFHLPDWNSEQNVQMFKYFST